ncbi:MAG: DUF4037 domain-containing protein [Desulfovibrio sp.]|nr:DUF4037 domain-containing protein [Desulfovibrio sp.]
MNGLELAKAFYEECGRPMLEAQFPELLPRLAIGLFGAGSECFGFDDEISRDHDWGPAFCIWLPERLLAEAMPRLDKALEGLPETFLGFPVRMARDLRMGRVGPLSVEGFYKKFLGVPRVPETIGEWLRIPEHYLATATNGEVFEDASGAFSAVREELLRCYPEDIRLKKLAARCMACAQAGQYNLPRMLRRLDPVSADLCRARFAEAAISLVFLLNRRYMPFYKWAFRGLKGLPVLGMATAERLSALMALPLMDAEPEDVLKPVEAICQDIASRLFEEGLADDDDPWLYAQGPAVQARIRHEGLRAMPPQME